MDSPRAQEEEILRLLECKEPQPPSSSTWVEEQCRVIIDMASRYKDSTSLLVFLVDACLQRPSEELAREVLYRFGSIERQSLDRPIASMLRHQVVLPRYDTGVLEGYGMDRDRKFCITDSSIIVYNWYAVVCIDRVTMKRRWQRVLVRDFLELHRRGYAGSVKDLQDSFITVNAYSEFVLVICPLGWLLLNPVTGRDMFSRQFYELFVVAYAVQDAHSYQHIVCQNRKGHDCLVIQAFFASATLTGLNLTAYVVVVQPSPCTEQEGLENVSCAGADLDYYKNDYFDPVTGDLVGHVPGLRRRYHITHALDLIPWGVSTEQCVEAMTSPPIKRVFTLAYATHLSLVWIMNGAEPLRSVLFNFDDDYYDDSDPFSSIYTNIGETFVRENATIQSTSVLTATTVNGTHLFLAYINPEATERSLVYEMWSIDLRRGSSPVINKIYRWGEKWTPRGREQQQQMRVPIYKCSLEDSWHHTDPSHRAPYYINEGALRDIFNSSSTRSLRVHLSTGCRDTPQRMLEFRVMTLDDSSTTMMVRWCDLDKLPLAVHHYILPAGQALVHFSEDQQYIYLIADSNRLRVLHLPRDSANVTTLYDAPLDVLSNDTYPLRSLVASGALVMGYNLRETAPAAPPHFLRVIQDPDARNGLLSRVRTQTKRW